MGGKSKITNEDAEQVSAVVFFDIPLFMMKTDML